ncbi:MAG: hypothetical protein NXI22_12840 [bacterium]|nr:hypothetical protein [bacterium]
MRLTLRTLLAYKSGLMKPTDYDEIGRLLKQSNAAAKVNARIDALLENPNDEQPKSQQFDSLLITDYLGNQLHDEAVLKFERRCLEDDQLLAEVAACNEILARFFSELPFDLKQLRPAVTKRVLEVLPKSKHSME